MYHQSPRLILRSIVFPLLMAVIVTLGGFPSPVSADLPPRPALAVAQKVSDDGGDKENPIGAHITLMDVASGTWTVVQWQDAAGNWHDVEGWRGHSAAGVTWWVAKKDFGTGPFRWVVFHPVDRSVAGVSSSFTLPQAANQVVQVAMP